MSARRKIKTLPEAGPAFDAQTKIKPLHELVETIMPAVVNILAVQEENDMGGIGSGFVIDGENGYIVTNSHVIDEREKILITLANDESFTATLVGRDPFTDVAVLKIRKPKDVILPQAETGNSGDMRVGHNIIAIGNPFGLASTVTTGIISGLHRDIGSGMYDDYIQTDAAINPGNSGGPMFNLAGQVIGLNTAIYSNSGSSSGVGFAIPINQVRWTATQIINFGTVHRAVLGAGIATVSTGLAKKFGVAAREGVYLHSVMPKGPAHAAGLRRNDIILDIDGAPMNDPRALRNKISESLPGEEISITFLRKGKPHQTNVFLGAVQLVAVEDGFDEQGELINPPLPEERPRRYLRPPSLR